MDFYRINEENTISISRGMKKKKEGLQRYLISDILIEINLLSVQLCRLME